MLQSFSLYILIRQYIFRDLCLGDGREVGGWFSGEFRPGITALVDSVKHQLTYLLTYFGESGTGTCFWKVML